MTVHKTSKYDLSLLVIRTVKEILHEGIKNTQVKRGHL
jgi:hypothetical protein